MNHLEDLIGEGGREALVARFWAHVDTSGECWLWTGGLTDKGYAQMKGPHSRRLSRKYMGAHRFSWELHHGPIPPGMFVCHRCDIPRCVNPAHLFLGTNSQNMLDASAKGRLHATNPNPVRGARHHSAVMTEEQVRAMRQRWDAGGVTTRQLADEFGVPRNAVYFAVHRRSWRWLV